MADAFPALDDSRPDLDPDLDPDEDDDEEEEQMTAAEVAARLERAWTDERFAPTLLPPRPEIVDCILDQLAAVDENVRQRAPRGGGGDGGLRVVAHRAEADRLRFVVAAYLRERLAKVELHGRHLLAGDDDDDAARRMTDEEATYAREFADGVDAHARQVALRHVPPNLQAAEARQAAAPNKRAYVFLRVNERVDGVEVEAGGGETEVVTLERGSQHVMQYAAIADLVESGVVSLI
ncbi:PREDICTED: DNA replication complex GINS protein SLD5-like [Priapulus caudatus]|uniref:DNA replication complex GINS protein SLD5 n=1 Tax=Priapulus caudatus TaxID=37621 RepID=A0ABM1F4D4_PRICU|nr:PREDICTED: DNA replication complex GINS protein SLD5-like [Priapulus caudatus]